MKKTREKKRDKGYPIFATLGKMLENVTRQNKKIYLNFVIYTLAASVYPLFAVMLPKYVLQELANPAGARVETLLIIVGVIFLLSAVTGFIRSFLPASTYFPISFLRLDYIKDMATKLLTADYRYMEDAEFFNENERATTATSGNWNGIERVYHLLFTLPADFITIMALVILIGLRSPVILLAMGVNMAAIMLIGRKVHAYRHSLDKEVGKANRRRQYYMNTTHDFGYGKDIRIYGLRDRVIDHYKEEIAAYVKLLGSIANREFALGFIGLFTLLLSDVATYGILIRDTLQGMSIADFSMYLTAVVSLGALLSTFISQVTTLVNEGHYAHDFYAFMDKDLGEKGGSHPAVQGDTLEVEFRDVSFKYPRTDRYVISHLNLTIGKGERLAIVGVNGAGKTTLVKLMTGLFAPTEGEIYINGLPIGQYDKKALYSMFSPVLQNVNVFAYSLLQNVTCQEDGDRARAEEALRKAGLGPKLDSLEKGLDQPMMKIIEEDGTEFSGGEAQKLAIARALYKGGNMVVMDEPTAALDALAEAEIYEQFSDLVEGKTAVYISHRLASTKFCDKIAFLDRDGLKEYGSHDELMALKGGYYHMFTVQGKYYNMEEGGGAA